jgi:hypothetical protein
MFFKLRKGKFLKTTRERLLRETFMGCLLVGTFTFDIIDLLYTFPVQLNMYLRVLFFLFYTSAFHLSCIELSF